MFISVMLIFPPSRGKLKPYRDGALPDESICEKAWVEINGFQQGMFLRGKDISNPVLLFLSGGPDIPDYFLVKKSDADLENIFTVCYWDYRGTALSYSPDCKAEDCTSEQFVQDAITMTDYLRKRFGQKKIYLLGHSFGTYIGLLAAQSAPEKYHAYIAISQIADQPRSELLAYNTMKAEYAITQYRKNITLSSKHL